MKASAILIIYTGGTIGMKQDPVDQTLKPFDFSQIADEVPELRKFAVRIDSYTFDPLIDSSDVEPSLWVRLAHLVRDRYDDYDGFVILHGTDTMAYSASALSFMLEGLTKPVIFTGSQLPIGVPRTDGKENLISAVEIAAAADNDGHAMVPEVSICFDSVLIRGNRATKLSAEAFNAFASPDCHPVQPRRHPLSGRLVAAAPGPRPAGHARRHPQGPSRHHARARDRLPPRPRDPRRHPGNLRIRQRHHPPLVPLPCPGRREVQGNRECNPV